MDLLATELLTIELAISDSIVGATRIGTLTDPGEVQANVKAAEQVVCSSKHG